MNIEAIQKLIKNVPSDYAQTISDRLNISKKTVYLAIEKGKMDHPVIEEMVKLAEEHKAKLVEIEQRINKVAS